MVKISVVVTVYNVENYIERCLNSILGQSFDDFELLVVDDKTLDNSMAIVKRHAERDSRIRIISNEVNSGLMWARKVGYENSIGEYVVFVDSDDSLPDNALLVLYTSIVERGADMLSGNISYIKLDGSIDVWSSELKYGNNRDAIYKSLLKNEYRHNLCGHIFKRSLLTAFPYKSYMNFTKWEDYCLFYQLVKNACITEHIDVPVYNYYQTGGSSTQVAISERSLETTFIAHALAFELLKDNTQLKGLLYAQNQRVIARLILRNNCSRKAVFDKVKQYLPNDIISVINILRYNSLSWSIKLIAAIYLIRK